MKYRFTVGQASWNATGFKPVMVIFFALLLCSGNSLLCAQEPRSISIRALKATRDEPPVIMAGLGEKRDIVRYAEGKPAGEKQDMTPVKPDTKAPSPQGPDEYGDVTQEEIGITSTDRKSSDEYGDVSSEEAAGPEGTEEIYDPIRPFNTVMYHFNDKVYFWVLKPVSTGYEYVLPEPVRGIFLNFYENLKAPIRIVNNLLQGDMEHAGAEFLSLLINSTIGVGGLRNCAQECFGIQRNYADFGQTLGKWGFGYGFYLVLPFFGPSDVRDGIGLLVDWPMRPASYVGTGFVNEYNAGLYAHETVNDTSFHLGEYEAMKSASVDPYVAMRDIYFQYRNYLIRQP